VKSFRSAATTAAMPYTIPTRYVAPSPVVLADTYHSIAGRRDCILQRGIP
jgi:hypothetical protein